MRPTLCTRFILSLLFGSILLILWCGTVPGLPKVVMRHARAPLLRARAVTVLPLAGERGMAREAWHDEGQRARLPVMEALSRAQTSMLAPGARGRTMLRTYRGHALVAEAALLGAQREHACSCTVLAPG